MVIKPECLERKTNFKKNIRSKTHRQTQHLDLEVVVKKQMNKQSFVLTCKNDDFSFTETSKEWKRQD